MQGDPTHGTGAQRAYALLSGMGVVEAGCSKKEMILLKQDKISDPSIKNFLGQGLVQEVTQALLRISKNLAL